MGSLTPARKLRSLMSDSHLIVAPGVWDPYTARIAERLGFEAVTFGGYNFGVSLVVAEAMTTLTEVATLCRYVTAAIQIPALVDAGAGFGEPLHVMRAVKELERAGAAAIHIEDQIFPKRVHYHKGVEHIISRQQMVAKIKAAIAARQNPDLVIVARTDAMRTDSFVEGVERANLYLQAGAEMVMIFPNTVEEARQAPREIKGRLWYTNSEGNRLGRPVFRVKDLEDMGYKVVGYSAMLICAVTQEIKRVLTNLKSHGSSGLAADDMIRWRKEVEDMIGLEEKYKLEKETVEH